MINFVKNIMGVLGLLILLTLFFACKENQTEPVAEMEMVTVAFKMPVDPFRTKGESGGPAVKEKKQADKQKTTKALPASASSEALPEKKETGPEIPTYSGEGKWTPLFL